MRSNVPNAGGEIRSEQERKVDKGACVEVERGLHLGTRDEQEGFVSARDVAEERRPVYENVLLERGRVGEQGMEREKR